MGPAEYPTFPKPDRSVGAANSITLPKSLVARVAAGIRTMLGDTSWMGPMDPPAQFAPADAAGRLWDYPIGYNLNPSPRGGEGVSFAMMRNLADNYDLLRVIIEGRKDQLAKFNWSIRPKDQEKKAKEDERCKLAEEFFQSPDKLHTWDDWLRMLLEDMLVIDAPTVYIRKTNGGELYALEPMDGATIGVLIDSMGRRPVAPAPAYAQAIKGINAIQYTTDELIYKPRNPRTNKVYGFSPVEQVIMTVRIALQRQLSQLEYFESGTLPDAIAGMPEAWTGQQVAEFQLYFDNLLADPSTRRKVRFVPKEAASTFHEAKPAPLKDAFDEWLARVICYAFSVEVTPFVAQVNRSVAETNREQALQEGLIPLQRWVKSIIDTVLSKIMGLPDLEFQWDEEEDIDPKSQAEIDQIYINCGVMSVALVQKRLGIDAAEEVDPKAEEPKLDAQGNPIPTPDPNAPVVPGGDVGAAGPNVQATALNGTQITSLQAIVDAVAGGQIPQETGAAMMQVSFPMVTTAQIDAMLNPLKNFEPKKPDPIGGLDANGNPTPSAPPEGDGVAAAEGGDPTDGGSAPFKPKAKDKKVITQKMSGGYGDLTINVSLPEIIVDVASPTVNIDGLSQPVKEN